MTYSIRIAGLGRDGKELLSIEPNWWTVSKIQALFPNRWVHTNLTGSYADADVEVSVEEARSVHAQFRSILLENIQFNADSLTSYAAGNSPHKDSIVSQYEELISKLEGQLDLLDGAVANASGEFANFHICVYEWDSGF